MEHRPLPNGIQRVVKLATLFTMVGVFTTMVVGHSLLKIHKDIQATALFLVSAERVKPNFEESLKLYTEDTQSIIDFITSLQPDNDEEVIQFIADLEGVGKKLSLNMKLKSIEPSADAEKNILFYEIDFYGSKTNLIEWLEALEELPYYIRILDIHFKAPSTLVTNPSEAVRENVQLTLGLYVQ